MVVEINGFLLAAKQSAFKTVNTTPEVAVGYIEMDIFESSEKIIQADSGSGYEQAASQGDVDARFTAHVACRLSGGLGRLLHALMGEDTKTGPTDSTYTHILRPVDSPPFLTVWQMFGTYTSYLKRLTGGGPDEVNIKWADKELSLEFKGPGWKPQIVSPPDIPTPSYLAPISKVGLTATVDSVPVYPISGEVTIKRNRDDGDFLSGSILRDSAPPRKFQMTVKLELKWEDFSWLKKQWGAAAATEPATTIYTFPISLLFEGQLLGATTKESMTVAVPVACFEPSTGTKGGAQQTKTFELNMRALVTQNNNTYKPSITLVNSDSADYDT